MKTKFLKSLSVIAIAAVLALNVTVVLDDNSSSNLNWDFMGKILADGTSGSGTKPEKKVYKKKDPEVSCTMSNGEEGDKYDCISSTTYVDGARTCTTSGCFNY